MRSKAARQKFLRKNLKKVNRDQFRAEAIDYMLFILANSEELQFAHYVIDIVIRNIADRVLNGEPEPDVDHFEDQYSNS